jgi:hypothetical protein
LQKSKIYLTIMSKPKNWTTKQNRAQHGPELQPIYDLWDRFCEWYIYGDHQRGKKPIQWSKSVSVWKGPEGAYPLPKMIIKAVRETGFAKVKFTYKISKPMPSPKAIELAEAGV